MKLRSRHLADEHMQQYEWAAAMAYPVRVHASVPVHPLLVLACLLVAGFGLSACSRPEEQAMENAAKSLKAHLSAKKCPPVAVNGGTVFDRSRETMNPGSTI